MDNIFVKILALLNKPIHYFLVGAFLIIWNKFIDNEPKYLLLVGVILVLLSIASIIEFIIRKIAVYNRKNKMSKQKEEDEKNKNEQLKNEIIWIQNEYKKLNKNEKEVIDYCIRNNSRVFQQDILGNYSEAINSLIAKGFANRRSNSLNFVINENVFLVLEKLVNENKYEVKNESK